MFVCLGTTPQTNLSVDMSLVPRIRIDDMEATIYIQLNSCRRLVETRCDGPHSLYELCVQVKPTYP